MDRKVAKFIVENAVQLFEVITRGGTDTFVRIGGSTNPHSVVINSDIINHFMDILPTIKLFADGADLQYYCELNKQWIDIETPTFTKGYSYRVKPEPRGYTLAVFKQSGQVHHVYPAGLQFPVNKDEYEYIKVLEVK